MRPDRIDKPPAAVEPNLADYESACASASGQAGWGWAREHLQGLPDGGLNIAHEAVTRHARRARARHPALRWLGKNGEQRTLDYAELERQTNRFANVLASLGVEPGQRVFSLAGRVPELYVGALGTLKHRAVFCPLFSAFGPEPIASRLGPGEGTVLLTTARLYQRKVAGIRDRLPALRHVLVVDETAPEGTLSLPALMAEASDEYTIGPTAPEDPALLHFTSGTTGKPKGALHVHEAVVVHHLTGRYALDLHPDDVYWCTADPGWVTGTSYGIIAPLCCGVTMIVDEGELDPRRWYGIIAEHRVDVWYTAPTAVRMLMKAGTELAQSYDLSSLRFVGSVGEPLNPEAIWWGLEALGRPIHDNWWQTETGGIMVANFASQPIKPGSMGRPLPGIEVAILDRDATEPPRVITEPDVEGELALRAGWPSMFRAYLGQPERYARCFDGPWYRSGDLARRDADGYLWFLGRADDVIKSAGHLIGPFEVESALMEHPAVAEVGVIGKPDPVAGNIVKAFVALRPGHEPGPELRRELMAHARKRLGPAVAPREIDFAASLPKTRSGKIMRRLLRARELGLPEGDTSTLESF
ncbi:MAG: acetate--CoA ligase [Nannocystaceae bacterium]